MKEEQIKKIIERSTIETSDGFINNIISSIEVNQERKKVLKRAFRAVFSAVALLTIVMSFVLYKYLGSENSLAHMFNNVPKTPFFVGIVIVLLVYLNSIIRLNEQNQI